MAEAERAPHSDQSGLTSANARARLEAYGPNILPQPAAPSFVLTFLRQFLSPLIYILLAAAAGALMLGDVTDAAIIAVVLAINSLIGGVQEFSANRATAALRKLETPLASVVRDGASRQISAAELVPGDLVELSAGNRVPADMVVQAANDLQCDESLLTGESASVHKIAVQAQGVVAQASRALAGTLVARGRGLGVVTATGTHTTLGKIAAEIARRSISTPPLIIRMQEFARNIAIAIAAAIALLLAIGFWHGMGARDLFMLSVGLAVSAIPEGLPVAVSIALAIGIRRMAAHNVVVRRMPAVESLGSCTLIAADKTGTLTLNQLTVTDVCLPDGAAYAFEASGRLEFSAIAPRNGASPADVRLAALLRAAALANEAHLRREGDGWAGEGDTVDVALLAAARGGGVAQKTIDEEFPLVARVPYEPERKYAASFHRGPRHIRAFVKGAPEVLIDMCSRMAAGEAAVPIDRAGLLKQKDELADRGLRVLAFAEGEMEADRDGRYGDRQLANLTFLGLAGMQDPVRPEVPGAIRDCRSAGIDVVVLTGDDPKTARNIMRQAGLEIAAEEIASGAAVREAEAAGTLDALAARTRLYARVEPAQKLAIVLALARLGHFVAVTGDGINDAPALRHAHVGVAMGRGGTDVAKESADIILTDDNFASIVAGIREGRVAYANIRKVIFMLVSTGIAEVLLFLLAMPFGLPIPLLPVQLLWLNLVTEGVQDVALAAEKAEGDELMRPPRRPREPVFDRIMIRRLWHSALVMGAGGFAVFWWLISNGFQADEARNLLLLLFVLFENFQTFNSRSERHSVFRQRLRTNPFLVWSVAGALALHIGAMYTPGLREILHIAPASVAQWAVLLGLASSIVLVMELEKLTDVRTVPR